MNGNDGAYTIDYLGDTATNRPSILAGAGDFMGEKTQAFVLEGEEARYPLQIHWKSGHEPKEFGFSIYRLDLVESVAHVVRRSKGAYEEPYDDITENLMVTQGALYQIVFENSYTGVLGDIQVTLGPVEQDLDPVAEYTIDTSKTEDNQWWQVKVLADTPTTPTRKNSKTLTLEMESHRLSEDFEWIIVTSPSPDYTSLLRHSSMNQNETSKVVAYGPSDLGSNLSESGEQYEQILMPKPIGTQSYALILTGASYDDTWLGEDRPVQLYDSGDPNDRSRLSLDGFETEGRIILFFSLADKRRAAAARSSIRFGFLLSSTMILASLTLL